MNVLAHYVREPDIAAQILAAAGRVLSADAELPRQVFGLPYACFAFFDYGVLQNAACWRELLAFADIATLVYLNPSAQDIFTSSGGVRYGILRLDSGVEADEVEETLSTSPTANPADAFVYGCMRCAILVGNEECAIFGDRYWDLAVVAFRSTTSRERFRACTGSWPYMAVSDAAKRIKKQSEPKDRSDFVAVLRANYPNATPLS
jgi:hypothetical protein